MNVLSKNKYRYYRSLKQKKQRQRDNKVIIEGIKLCQEAFAADLAIETFLFYPRNIASDVLENFIKTCLFKSIPTYEISLDMLQGLSDTVHSQGVLCIINTVESLVIPANSKLILALNSVNDPGNLGTIIRTADWFGIDAILISDDSVELYNPKVVRSTMGSIFHLPIISNVNLTQQLIQLKNQGFKIYAADIHADLNYDEEKFPARKVLVIGNESQGISPDIISICNQRIKISNKGKAESLNMAIAAGIILSRMVNYE